MAVSRTKTDHARKIGTIAYASGQRATLDIDRDGILMALALRLKFTVTNSATGPVGPLFEALAALLARIEVIVGGRDTVWSIGGPSLAARLFYEHGLAAYGMDATVVLTNSAATTYDVVIPLEFFLRDGRRPDDTGLDLRRVSTCTLAVTWGASDCSGMFTTPNSAAVSGVTLEVEGEYLLGADDNAVYLVRALDQVESTITGSQANFAVTLDRGTGSYYRSFQVECLKGNIGNDSILNTGAGIGLVAGSFVFRNRGAVQVQAANRRMYAVAPKAGVYILPLSFFGQAVTWINSGALTSDLKLNFDVAFQAGATNLLRVTRESVRPLKLA